MGGNFILIVDKPPDKLPVLVIQLEMMMVNVRARVLYSSKKGLQPLPVTYHPQPKPDGPGKKQGLMKP